MTDLRAHGKFRFELAWPGSSLDCMKAARITASAHVSARTIGEFGEIIARLRRCRRVRAGATLTRNGTPGHPITGP
jgi:hypothetical protein